MKQGLTYIFIALFFLLSTSCQPENLEVINVNTSQFNQLMQDNPEMMVLDIRTPKEFTTQHIKGAVNIDFYGPNFVTWLNNLDKERPILLHCRSGNRSKKSLAIFQKLNFTKIYHLNRGIVGGWPKRE